MVTKKQSKEYERLHKLLVNTYHEKESGREAIVQLFEEIPVFFEAIEAEGEIIFQENNIFHATINQQEFLGGMIKNFRDIASKANKFGEDTLEIYEEVEKCMELMINVCAQLGSTETDKKASEVMLINMGKRIEASKATISKSTVDLNQILSSFDAFKALYNSRKN